MSKLSFFCDYMEGAHPAILRRLTETNMEKTPGYGLDEYSASAKAKIREACRCPEAEIFFLVGGTQTNATVIDAMLCSYQGVMAAESGHVSVHEAGAIEHDGHKVLPLPQHNGKIKANQIRSLMDDYRNNATHERMVMPGMVYISQPTEFGTLYSLAELREISAVCREYGLALYVDGARLAMRSCARKTMYPWRILRPAAMPSISAAPSAVRSSARPWSSRRAARSPTFSRSSSSTARSSPKELGLQFDTLFTDGLYERIGIPAIQAADRIREALMQNGYTLCFDSPTN